MLEEQSFMGSILIWAGLRQLQALRESLGWSLAGEFQFLHDGTPHRLDENTLSAWLATQGCNVSGRNVVDAIQAYRTQLLGPDAVVAMKAGQRTRRTEMEDFGHERGGAGWMNAANFCITSAFVRMLGAWEQFEVDVLKALFYYRPMGRQSGPVAEKILEEIDESVIRELPVNRQFEKPPLWTWICKPAENNVERHKILSNVFDVKAVPSGGNYETWYKKRNLIAHGREHVTMTLGEYVEADVFIYRSMRFVADQVRDKHHLLI